MQNQKGISTLVGIIIIIAIAVILFGSVFAYQYFLKFQTPNQIQNSNVQNQNNQDIRPLITVTSPNGGETLSLGQNYKISWTSSGLSDKKGNISLMEYDQNSKGLGAQWIAFSVPISQGYYNWTPNAEIPAYFSNTNKYKIIIKPDPNTETFTPDESDNYFSIVASTDQTVGWKTYTNTNYGFEFKYPINASVGEYSNKYYSEETVGVTVDYSDNKTNPNRPIFNVRIFEKGIDKVLGIYTTDGSVLRDQVYKSSFVTGRAISVSMTIGDVNNIIMVEHNGRTFVMSNNTAEDSEILSTFKFTTPQGKSFSVDLNNDGKVDLLTLSTDPIYCGSGGCQLSIYKNTDDGLILVNKVFLVHSVFLSNTYTNSWKDIIVGVGGGGYVGTGFTKLQFDGKSYPQNPTTQGTEIQDPKLSPIL